MCVCIYMYVYNNKGPNTDPGGTPSNISSQLLYAELIFVLHFQLLRELKTNFERTVTKFIRF